MTGCAPPDVRGPRRGSRWSRPVGLAACSLLVAALLVGPVVCLGDSASTATAATASAPVPRELREPLVPVPPPVTVDPAVLEAVEAAAAQVQGSVEVVVVDAAGRTVLETAAADRPFYTASLVKLLVVQQVLAREAAGVLALAPDDGGRLEAAVTVSDDPAMSLLWDSYDGADLVASAAATFGLTATAAPDEVGQWGQSTTSATDLARLLTTLSADPETPGAARLLEWMRRATPLASDGFDQRFGLLAEGSAPGAAVKQGWMCCVDDRRQLHSAGVLADGRVVVVLVDAPATRSWDGLAGTVDAVTATVVAGTV